jgi:hypothetical protein
MNNSEKVTCVLVAIIACCCVGILFEFHSQNVAYNEGYTEGYNEHNETMFNYTSQYIEVYSPPAKDYRYNLGYCKGYKVRSVDDMKPE